jgi:DNA adenine methylase
MKYMWSKNRIAKYLLPIILKDRKEWQYYVEPFVWWANMIDKVDWNRIWADVNKFLISFLRELSYWNFDFERFYSKEQYNDIRYNFHKYSYEEIWYVWINCSYGWSWFESYAWISAWRNYQEEAIKNIKKQMIWLKWVKFIYNSYNVLEIPDNSIIYCDIPYKWVRQYNYDKWIDYDKFYNWCREKKKQWHQIYISEYQMPDDFICIYEKELTNSLHKTQTKKSIEKLFTL